MEVEAGIECERASCMCCVCVPRCLAWRLTCNAPYFHILNLLDWLLFFPLCNFLFPASYPIFCLPFFSLFVSSSTQVFFLAFLLPSKITLVHTHTQQTVCEETLLRYTPPIMFPSFHETAARRSAAKSTGNPAADPDVQRKSIRVFSFRKKTNAVLNF